MNEKRPVFILGISESHTATAALLKDGEIIACASEERFTRKKLQTGVPTNAINYCLDFAQIEPKDLTMVACADILPMFPTKQDSPYARFNFFKFCLEFMLTIEVRLEQIYPKSKEAFYKIYKFIMETKIPSLKRKRLERLQKKIPLASEKFTFWNHHLCHAAASLFSSKFPDKKRSSLIFTCDGVGDFESATLFKFKNNRLKKLVNINSQQSLGFFYLHITQLLGLKPVEDEYKVMGLAPYADGKKSEKVYAILKPFFSINNFLPYWTMRFSEIHLARNLSRLLANLRFDHIAASAQRILEEVLAQWVINCVQKYKVANLAFGGGVFANVKVNQKISRLKSVRNAFFMPSPGDESNAIGAAYYAFFNLTKTIPKPLDNLYLGPEFGQEEIEKILKTNQSRSGIGSRYRIVKHRDINSEVAKLLAEEQVVARFAGRMEFGARALGNRSILARPDQRDLVEFINSAIKNRDFWMPFAPTILREQARDYLILHKADSPFMNVAYDTTPKGQVDLAAAIHPSDKTTRPQILDKDVNPVYWDLIKKFEKLTGIGAVLNTSCNLHGEPIVCTPHDAIQTFIKSSLKYLLIEKWLLIKK